MSRIADKPISIPNNVDVSINGNIVQVKGPLGSLSQEINKLISVVLEGKTIKVSRLTDEKFARAMSGTSRALLNNMVTGVSTGFSKALELVGVGYRAQLKGNSIDLSLGFSHPVSYNLPQGVSAEVPSNTSVIIKGTSKQAVGQVAAEIRAIRPPEPYKGKGVKYVDETIIRKETKKK